MTAGSETLVLKLLMPRRFCVYSGKRRNKQLKSLISRIGNTDLSL